MKIAQDEILGKIEVEFSSPRVRTIGIPVQTQSLVAPPVVACQARETTFFLATRWLQTRYKFLQFGTGTYPKSAYSELKGENNSEVRAVSNLGESVNLSVINILTLKSCAFRFLRKNPPVSY